jgi:hypothetical protein
MNGSVAWHVGSQGEFIALLKMTGVDFRGGPTKKPVKFPV